MKHLPVKHPDWLVEAAKKWETLARLKRTGRLPPSIEGWMFETDARYALRAIYGSDLRASWSLFIRDLWAWIKNIRWWMLRFWRYKVMQHSPDADRNAYLAELEAEADEEDD